MARTSFVKPVVVASECLTQAACRWDGDRISYPFARLLRKYARLITVCPEVEIGLGVPRDQIVLIERQGSLILFQPTTGRRLTKSMSEFSRQHLAGLKDVDGFLLKSKSPSCGVRDTKRFDREVDNRRIVGRGPGLYATEVLKAYPVLAIEDERRLKDHRIREHWLTRLFMSSDFRSVRKRPSVGRLEAFHRRHALLLKVYNKTQTTRLEKLVDAASKNSIKSVTAEYERTMALILRNPAKARSIVESMSTAFKYYSAHLDRSEKERYRKMTEACLAGVRPVNELRKLIQVWAVRYDKNFTRQHSLYRPYPGPLAVVG